MFNHKAQPVIGVFLQECPKYKGELDIQLCPHGSSSLPASYVKYIESFGAQALIIPSDFSEAELTELISTGGISGLLLPGGGGFKWDYFRLARKAIREVLDLGLDLPIFGICMGFELIMAEAFEKASEVGVKSIHKSRVLEDIVNTEHVGLPVTFHHHHGTLPAPTSLFHNLPEDLITSAENLPITSNAHIKSVFLDTFTTLQDLSDESDLSDFLVTSTSRAPGSKRDFIASFQHKDLPIYGVQYHPEKSAFELNYNVEDISATEMIHSWPAVEFSTFIGKNFVDICKNRNLKLDGKFEKYLSKNWTPVTPKPGTKMAKHYGSIYIHVFAN